MCKKQHRKNIIFKTVQKKRKSLNEFLRNSIKFSKLSKTEKENSQPFKLVPLHAMNSKLVFVRKEDTSMLVHGCKIHDDEVVVSTSSYYNEWRLWWLSTIKWKHLCGTTHLKEVWTNISL